MPETVATVRLKYAYEDAFALADDLAVAHESELATEARALAIKILDRFTQEGGKGAALPPLHSVKV